MIRLEAVYKAFGTASAASFAIEDLSIEIGRGETVCLIGPSGSGKTSTLRLINRLIEPTSGRVLVDGADVSALDAVKLRRSMGYVIQSGGLFPHMTVAQNVGLLCRIEGWSDGACDTRVRELLELARLDPAVFSSRYPSHLSGGERQRVGVARALALDPDVLLMDEPFGALDPITRGQLQAEFVELLATVEKTVVLVTHDLHEAFLLGDRVGLMRAGRLEQIGTREDLVARPANDFVREFVARHVHAL